MKDFFLFMPLPLEMCRPSQLPTLPIGKSGPGYCTPIYTCNNTMVFRALNYTR